MSYTSTFTATYTNSCGSKSTQASTHNRKRQRRDAHAHGGKDPTPCQNCGTNGRVLAGYWQRLGDAVMIQLRNVPTSWSVIVVAFANYNGGGTSPLPLTPMKRRRSSFPTFSTCTASARGC